MTALASKPVWKCLWCNKGMHEKCNGWGVKTKKKVCQCTEPHPSLKAAWDLGTKQMSTPEKLVTVTPIPSLIVSTPLCLICKVGLCDDCGCCHTETCILNGKSILNKSDLAGLSYLTARTQKARGYAVLSQELNVPKPFYVITTPEEVQLISSMGPGVFVRPCPVRPRHGFVESRPVKAGNVTERMAEVQEIFNEAKAADPEAELLIVPTIKASHNVILTPARMAIGPGNDGATAGRKSVIFPLAGVPFLELSPAVIAKAGVSAAEDPYVEAVLIKSTLGNAYVGARHPTEGVFFTQLRAGAKIAASVGADFVPEQMTVQRVIEASGDLLEWERQVKEDITPGTVVYHLGGTLVSHYGVHCIFHNVPMLTTRMPVVGEVLVPTRKPERPVPEAVIRGLAMAVSDRYIGLTLSKDHDMEIKGSWAVPLQTNQAVALLLIAAHNAVAMTGDDGKWLGIAAVLMLRLGMAASHGEARHRKAEGDLSDKHSRALVYKLALNDFFGARQNIGCAQWRFRELKWSSSYGGPKWAACTESILRLEKAAQDLIRTPSDAKVTELVDALHNAINQAHNGGWWLNKFVKQFVFDKTSQQSMYPLCASAPHILDIAQMEIDEGHLLSVLERWAKEPEPAIVRGYELDQKLYDPANQPVSITEVLSAQTTGQTTDVASTEGATTDIPFDSKCGDDSCTMCYPDSPAAKKIEQESKKLYGDWEKKAIEKLKPKLMAAAAASKIPYMPAKVAGNVNGMVQIPPSAVVECAQAVTGGGKIHIQYKVKDISGYFSFNAPLKEPIVDVDHDLKSFSGSGNMYFKMDVKQSEVSMTWHFYNTKANVHVEHALSEGAK